MMIEEAHVVEMLREAGANGPFSPNWVKYISEFLSSGRVGQDSPAKYGRGTELERSAQRAFGYLKKAVGKLAASYRSTASIAEDQDSVYDNDGTVRCNNAEVLTTAAEKMSKWIEAAPTFHPKDRKQNYLGEVIIALDAMTQRAVVKRCPRAVRVRSILRALKEYRTKGSFSEYSICQSIKRSADAAE